MISLFQPPELSLSLSLSSSHCLFFIIVIVAALFSAASSVFHLFLTHCVSVSVCSHFISAISRSMLCRSEYVESLLCDSIHKHVTASSGFVCPFFFCYSHYIFSIVFCFCACFALPLHIHDLRAGQYLCDRLKIV